MPLPVSILSLVRGQDAARGGIHSPLVQRLREIVDLNESVDEEDAKRQFFAKLDAETGLSASLNAATGGHIAAEAAPKTAVAGLEVQLQVADALDAYLGSNNGGVASPGSSGGESGASLASTADSATAAAAGTTRSRLLTTACLLVEHHSRHPASGL